MAASSCLRCGAFIAHRSGRYSPARSIHGARKAEKNGHRQFVPGRMRTPPGSNTYAQGGEGEDGVVCQMCEPETNRSRHHLLMDCGVALT
jgi:hypothetical protein